MKNKYKYYCLFAICLYGILLSCSTQKKTVQFDKNQITPPNCLYVNETLMVDRTEINNHNWREYAHWIGRVFGSGSKAYMATIPDTTVWLAVGEQYAHLVDDYYRSPKYDNHPVVGISQEQAMAYSRWRTDRVFEMLLISHDALKPEPLQNADSYFTVEGYLAGRYKNYVPNPSIDHFAVYSLPTPEERKAILQYYDSKQAAQKDKAAADAQLTSKENVMANEQLFGTPTRPSRMGKTKVELYNLRGNVAEWAKTPNTVFGGSWRDGAAAIQAQDVATVLQPNAWTGFRCVCRWKKIDSANN